MRKKLKKKKLLQHHLPTELADARPRLHIFLQDEMYWPYVHSVQFWGNRTSKTKNIVLGFTRKRLANLLTDQLENAFESAYGEVNAKLRRKRDEARGLKKALFIAESENARLQRIYTDFESKNGSAKFREAIGKIMQHEKRAGDHAIPLAEYENLKNDLTRLQKDCKRYEGENTQLKASQVRMGEINDDLKRTIERLNLEASGGAASPKNSFEIAEDKPHDTMIDIRAKRYNRKRNRV